MVLDPDIMPDKKTSDPDNCFFFGQPLTCRKALKLCTKLYLDLVEDVGVEVGVRKAAEINGV